MAFDHTDAEHQCGPVAEGFRNNVALLLERGDGRIFLGERVDRAEAWQFPQGGVDAGESLRNALHREVKEEIGLAPETYEIIDQRGGYRYLFPEGHRKGDDYRGQEQTYFHCLFTGNEEDIDLRTGKPEFNRYQWLLPADFNIDWLPEFKRGVYISVLADFFGVDLLSC